MDIWALGCIFYELKHRKPLFRGDSEVGQLFKIFKVLGTPTEANWHGSQNLPNMNINFPKWSGNKLGEECPNLKEQPDALDLL